MNEKEQILKDAILQRKTVSLYYDAAEIRICAPFTLGISTAGNSVVRLWQLFGFSKTAEKLPCWRLFRVDKIENLVLMDQTFFEIPPGYNPNDRSMTEVKAFVPV